MLCRSTSICTILFCLLLNTILCQVNKTIRNINVATELWPMAICAMEKSGIWPGYSTLPYDAQLWMLKIIISYDMTSYGYLMQNSCTSYHLCGPGAILKPPVDGIDECCRIHDDCFGEYDTVIWKKCCKWWQPNFSCGAKYESYKYACDPKAKEMVHCNTVAEGNNECEFILCNCDKALVDCWAQYAEPKKAPDCGTTEWKPSTIPTTTTTASTSTTTTPTSTTATSSATMTTMNTPTPTTTTAIKTSTVSKTPRTLIRTITTPTTTTKAPTIPTSSATTIPTTTGTVMTTTATTSVIRPVPSTNSSKTLTTTTPTATTTRSTTTSQTTTTETSASTTIETTIIPKTTTATTSKLTTTAPPNTTARTTISTSSATTIPTTTRTITTTTTSSTTATTTTAIIVTKKKKTHWTFSPDREKVFGFMNS